MTSPPLCGLEPSDEPFRLPPPGRSEVVLSWFPVSTVDGCDVCWTGVSALANDDDAVWFVAPFELLIAAVPRIPPYKSEELKRTRK